jgi:hypothetical protein
MGIDDPPATILMNTRFLNTLIFKLITLASCFAFPVSWIGAQETRIAAFLTGAEQVPPNQSTASAHAILTLTGTNVGFVVSWTFPRYQFTSGGFYGPAESGSLAPLIVDVFAIGQRAIVAPGEGFPGGILYYGNSTLTENQFADLAAGKWYASLSSEAFPNGEIRGQFSVIPEPSPMILFLLASVVLVSIRSFQRIRRCCSAA